MVNLKIVVFLGVTSCGVINTEDSQEPAVSTFRVGDQTLPHNLILFLKIEEQGLCDCLAVFVCSLFQFMNHLTDFRGA